MAKGSLLKQTINRFNFIGFWNHMVEHFGFKFTLMLVSAYFGVKGALKEFAQGLELPFYREGGWDASVKQVNSTVSQLPNAMKGFAGALSDLIPLFGYEKSSYIIIYSCISTICILILALVDFKVGKTSDKIPTMLFFGVYMQSAFIDLLMEGKYVDLMKRSPASKGAVISFSYFMITIGGFIPGLSVGSLATVINVKYIFYIALPFAAQPIIFTSYGCVVDDKASPSRNNRFDIVKAKNHWKILTLTLAVAFGSLLAAIIGLLSTPFVQFVYSLISAIFVALLAYAFLPIMVASANVYIFLNQTLYLDFSSHLEYFYMADDQCVKDGPHFDYLYFKTYVTIMSVLAQLVGIWIFQTVITSWKYRPIFWVTTCLRCAASVFDIVIINRWNIALGIPDKLIYMLGNTIVYQACYMMDFLPATLMISKICPKDIEVSLFAVLAGYGNFGQAVGKFIGNFLITSFGVVIKAQGPGCVYNNLTYVIIIGHFIFPLIQVPLTFFLIPDNYVHENIVDDTFDNPRYLFKPKKQNKFIAPQHFQAET